MQERQPPVTIGEEFDVTVEAVGEKGDGIARRKGFVLFIPGVKEGERIRIRVTKVLSKVGFAEKVGEAQAAPARESRGPVVAPAAPVHYEDSEDFGEDDLDDVPKPPK